MVRDSSARRRFIQNLLPYLQKYGFRGIHFDWNYPRCWQSDCRKGPESDRPNFTKLIKEISAEFQKRGLILGVGISGYKEIIAKSYELEELSNAADFLTVMTYGMTTITFTNFLILFFEKLRVRCKFFLLNSLHKNQKNYV